MFDCPVVFASKASFPTAVLLEAFVLYVNYDSFGRTLIYTHGGDMVCIDPDELFYTGFD